MAEQLLKTKIIPPRIPDYILYRTRLLNQLKSNINKRIMLVCADAGYGKTTLIAQFVKKVALPYVWYQIDKSDQDLNLFIRYMIEGMRRYIPDFGKRTLSVINDSGGQEIKLEILVGTFINELLEVPGQRILLVFDDLHEVYGSKKLVAGFRYLLHHIPANVTIIVSARSTPPFSLARFQFKHETVSIDHGDLKFNRDDIKALYKQVSGYVPKPVELEKFEMESEGWITCLQFLVQPVKQRPTFAKSIKSLIRRLYDYFDKEVFSSLNENVRSFLMATSVFDYLSPEACDFLMSKHDSHQILKILEKKHLFISPYDAPEPSYRYHHLFRDFLIKRLKTRGPYQKFQKRAGLYWKRKSVFATAIQHYFEAKNLKVVAQLIEKIGDDYISLGKVAFIEEYIAHLPETIITMSPTLMRLRGRISEWNCDWDGATLCYTQAKRRALRQRNYPEVFKTTYRQLVLKLYHGERKGVIRQTKKTLRSKKLKSRKMKALFLHILAWTFMNEGKIKRSIAIFEEVLKLFKKVGDSVFIDSAIHNLALAQINACDFSRAHKYLKALVVKLRLHPKPLLIITLEHLGTTLIHQGNTVQAEKVYKEAMKYAQLFNDKRKILMCLVALGRVKLSDGDLEQAAEQLKKAEKLAHETGHEYQCCHIWRLMADLAYRQGNLFEARHYIDQALEIPGHFMPKMLYLTTKAKIELSLKNFNIAKNILTQVLPHAKETKLSLMEVYLQLARYYFLKKDETKAKFFLYKSISIAKRNTYDFDLLGELKQCPEIIRFVRRLRLKSPYLQHILLKLPYPEPAEIAIEPIIEDYNFVVRLFGGMQVFKDGKEVRASSWHTKQFQELFSLFVANPLQTLTREKILSMFWPDNKPATAKQLFYNALYRIRKIVGKNIILFNKRGYSLSSKYRFWIDAEEFEKLAHRGNRLLQDGNSAAALIKYEEAFSLYRDDFMDDFYSDWCQHKRRYLEGMYLDVLKKLANGHYKIDNFEKALKFCNLSIKKDPYYEEVHCVAMRCYAALNDLGGLQHCFRNLQTILAKDLKTKPQSETAKLFERLIKRRKT